MANEMTLFKSGSQLPDYLRDSTDDLTKRLAGGYDAKSISIEGMVWRMIVGGEEIARNEERAMNFVVVNAAPHVSRTYFKGTYIKGQSTAPDCASADGIVPAPEIESPQSHSCATCPQNVKGSGQGDSRACRFNQRFAVVLEGDISGNVYRLQLPAKSLFGKAEGDKMPLQAYAKFLAGNGVPLGGVVTEARFDSNESVPVLKFRAVRPLTRPEYESAKAQAVSPDAMQAIEFKVPKKDTTPAAPAAFNAASPPQNVPVAANTKPVEPTVRKTKQEPAPVTAPASVTEILEQWGSDD